MTKVRSRDDSMISDRRTQGGGGGGFSFPGGGMPFPMKAGGGLIGIIILVAAVILPQLMGGGSASQSGVANPGDPTEEAADGTCSSEIEQIVCGVAIDAQDYWARGLPEHFGTEYQPTKTVFFENGVSTGCGQATSQTGPFYCPLDNLVYIDLGFMQQLEERLVGTTSDLAEQYIVAHEYGHHVQNVLGINAQVHRAQQSDPERANQYSVALELQADCFAGVWVGDAAARGLLDSPNEIAEAVAAAEGVGDDRIQQSTQGRVDPESWTHGSAEQRQTWFLRGYETVDPNECDTFSEIL